MARRQRERPPMERLASLVPGQMDAPVFVTGGGAAVRRRGGRMVVTVRGVEVASTPLFRVSELVVCGPVAVSVPVLHGLLGQGVPVVFLRRDGRLLGRLEPAGGRDIETRRRQLRLSMDDEACLLVAREVVAAKIANQRVLVGRRARNRSAMPSVVGLLEQMRTAEEDAIAATSTASLFGIEGAASRAYFGSLRAFLADDLGFRRRGREQPDVVNALLNYCSALLRETVVTAVVTAGLDPHTSFFHTAGRGRPTLAFDLMEEWRPVLLESTVLALVGLGAVGPDDVSVTPRGPRLGAAARGAAVRRFHARLDSAASGRSEVTGGRTYEQQVHAQVRLLRAWVRGDVERYEGFRWR